MTERQDGGAGDGTAPEEVLAALQGIPVPAPAWRAGPAELVAAGRRRHRRVRAARGAAGMFGLVALVGLAGAGLAAVRDGGPDVVDASPAGPAAATESPSPSPGPSGTPSAQPSSAVPSSAGPAVPAASPPGGPGARRTPPAGSAAAEVPAPVLEDGRHTVFLTDVDVDGREVTFDLVQFLTGDEAVAAWREAYPDDPEDTPPNDYFIVNSNLRLRTLPVADSVKVTLVHLATDSGAGSEDGTFEELPRYLTSSGGLAQMRDGTRSGSPYDLKVVDGEIVRIDERFVP